MWQRFKDGFRGFMQGRNGTDQLSLALLLAGLVLSLLSNFINIGLFFYIGTILYILSLFRMFSKNVQKRREENRKYLEFKAKLMPSIRQFITRVKNMNKYKYFRCPNCKSRLRLPRKVGEVTVTCSKCKNSFRMKA